MSGAESLNAAGKSRFLSKNNDVECIVLKKVNSNIDNGIF